MRLPTDLRVVFAASLISTLVLTSGCVDIVGADIGRYVERDEKHFTTTGKPQVDLSTFDGSIEVRPWDKPEVQVIIEKRASTKEAAETIEVLTNQTGDRITVEVKTQRVQGFNFHFNLSKSAKLIVSLPASSDLIAKSGDGSIDVERVTGHVELRSGDGSIRARELGGDLTAHTGDGSIKVEGVKGALNVDTGDGSINVSGKLSSVRARTGDGSVTIHADAGSAASGDWDITTGDGSVTLEFPADFGADIDAHTGDGGIRMHDVTLSDVTGRIARNSVKGKLGQGGRAVRVRTGDGSITLRRN